MLISPGALIAWQVEVKGDVDVFRFTDSSRPALGLLRIDVQVPGDVPAGAVPVLATIAGVTSPAEVTVSVR